MKWWPSVLLVLLAAASGCSAPAARAVLAPPAPRAPRFIRVGVVEGKRTAIHTVRLEEYVQATSISEFAPASGDLDVVERMLEVQAVVGRTYALAHLGRHARGGFDLCATTHCQLYEPARLRTSRWAAAAAEAAQQTSGSVLWFDGAAASVLFHADCGGHTSNSADVWGGPGRPYLVGIADDGPAESAHAAWRFEATRDAVMRALNADPRTRVGARLDGIKILERDAAGRALRVALHAQQERIVGGGLLREVLARALGARTVRSTWFDVRRGRGTFVFEGRGFGHGVGLCQAGALARIRAGTRLPAILQRYFPGTRLITLG
ncbi:MAG: SpoIID/LytB domain-containing protein [Gemmatimonadales bacterium]|nr:SpoIID/LytB domain-containing protein [Gemmatimonadales bacterium]